MAKLVVEVDDKGVVKGIRNLNEYTKASKGAATATDKLGTSTQKTNDQLRYRNGLIAGMSSQIKTVGRDLTRYLTLPIIGAGAAGIKFAQDLNSGLGQVQTLIPNTGDRIYELRDALTDISVESGRSFDDLTTGLYETISAFQDGEDTVGRFNAAVRAGIAGNATTVESVKLISAVTKAYGDTSTEAAEKVSDLAFETVRLGQTTFKELATGIQTATDSADRLGVSQEELFAVFSSLTGVVGDASEVATKFRSAAASLLNPTETLSALYRELGVDSGEAFIAQEGLLGAFQAILKASEETDTPIQKYIKRIEGITIVSRLAGRQSEDFARKLAELEDFAGATDQAFSDATEGINEFGFDLAQAKQQLAVAATTIGESLLPYVVDLVEQIAKLAEAYANLTPLGRDAVNVFLGLVALAGPVTTLVGSIGKLLAVASKFGIAMKGAAVAIGLVPAALIGIPTALLATVEAMDKAGDAAREQKKPLGDLTVAYEELTVASQQATIAQYEDALARAQNNLTAINDLRRERERELRDDPIKAFEAQRIGSTFFEDLDKSIAEAEDAVELFEQELFEALNRLQNRGREVKIAPAPDPALLKTWQEWFEEITGVSKETFGESGKLAAELYLQTFQDNYNQEEFYATLFGRDFDPKPLLEAEMRTLIDDVIKLLEIPKEEVRDGKNFVVRLLNGEIDTTGTSEAIRVLVERIRDLYEQLEKDADPIEITVGRDLSGLQALEKLQVAREEFGIAGDRVDYLSARLDVLNDLFEDAFYDKNAGALRIYGEEIRLTQEEIAALTAKVEENEEAWRSWTQVIDDAVTGKLVKISGLSEGAAGEIGNLVSTLAEAGVDLITDSFYELGRAIGEGALNANNFADAMGNIARQLLETLPMMFVQAGLNQILNGNVALGTTLLVTGGAGFVVQGYVDSVSENAHGNAYSAGNIIPFSAGGAFTNSIVDSPTLFPFAQGTGRMGEAGPEAIMPLTRTPSGDLGVRVEGGASANVNVVIENNTGEEVSVTETEGPNGNELRVIIGNVVKGQMNSGEFDRPLRQRYGVRPQGVA